MWNNNYIPVAIAGVFYHLSRRLAHKAQTQSEKNLLSIVDDIPSKVWIQKTPNSNLEVEIDIALLKAKDIITVSTGNMIPIDGYIQSGEGIVDQRSLTGESQPSEKSVGDSVFAGSLLVAGKLWIEVDKAGSETTVAKINHVLTQTVHFKTQNQLKSEQLANKIALPLLVIAAGTGVILNPSSMLVVLNSTVGSLVNVIGSVGTLRYLNIASKLGVLIKDGHSLETLNEIDTVLFDKTGTLTEEEPEVFNIISLDDRYDQDLILEYAAAAEQKLSHPIARAIVKAAKKADLSLSVIDDANYKLGRGIRVIIEGNTILVGSNHFMESEKISLTDMVGTLLSNAKTAGRSMIFVAKNGQLMGAIELQSQLRPEAKKIVQKLRQQKIKHIAIVSGDNKEPVEYMAKLLDIDLFFYEVLPEEKAQIVEQLQQEGKKVCFVGDGINDTIAMKQADVSISLKGASTIATDAAQIVMMDGTLSKLSEIFTIAKTMDSNLKSNLDLMLLPVGINIAGVYLFGFGIVTAIIIKNLVFFIGLGKTVMPSKKMQV